MAVKNEWGSQYTPKEWSLEYIIQSEKSKMQVEEANPLRQKNKSYQGPGAGEEWNEELLFNGYRVSVKDNGKVLEINCDNGCTTSWMYLMPVHCILKCG